jgi:hypothetical protein
MLLHKGKAEKLSHNVRDAMDKLKKDYINANKQVARNFPLLTSWLNLPNSKSRDTFRHRILTDNMRLLKKESTLPICQVIVVRVLFHSILCFLIKEQRNLLTIFR